MAEIKNSEICWKRISLSEANRYGTIAALENSSSADFAFANIYMWDETYCQLLAYVLDRAVVRVHRGNQQYYVCPIGTGPLRPVIDALHEDAEKSGVPFCLSGVTASYLAKLTEDYPDRFTVTADRNYYDYIYEADNLISLSGKSLHAKKNHCNRFSKQYSWSFEPIETSSFSDCMAIVDAWDAAHAGVDTVTEENRAIRRGFAAWNTLHLLGGILKVDEKLVAFSVGEQVSADTACVHFEKTLPGWDEAYPVINREFARYLKMQIPEIRYINREDDMGLENLRKAKESYQPVSLLEKYTLCWKE